jgi:signal transduction histidine kinase
MTVRARLLGTITLIGLLLAGPALYGIGKLRELRDIATELRGRHAEAFLSLGRLQAALVEFDRVQRSYLVIPTADNFGRVNASLTAARQELQRLIEAGYGDAVRETHSGLASIHAAAIQIDALVHEARIEEASAFFEEVKPVIDSVLASLDPVGRAVDQMSSSAADEAQRISVTATTAALGALLASTSIALILALAATGMLTRPLRRLRAATSAVAAGELVAPPDLPYDRADEIGDLSRSFRAMTHRLAELDRLKGEFLSIASHELKTPINVIGGYAELLEDGIYGEISSEQREVMSAIRAQARDLTNLANHLLDLGRVESGNFPIHFQEMELRPLFGEVERAFRALATLKRIDFEIELDPSTPATIAGDPQRLRQEVLGNLLSNAFKFTPEGGRIRVHASAATALHITVTDSGVGIPAELLPQIFEKYYQVRSDARSGEPPGGPSGPASGGSGLGLAIAREILEAHGGTIHAESKPGQGTTMHIQLPLSDQPLRREVEAEALL